MKISYIIIFIMCVLATLYYGKNNDIAKQVFYAMISIIAAIRLCEFEIIEEIRKPNS